MLSYKSTNNCPPATNDNSNICCTIVPSCNKVNKEKTNNRFGQRAGHYRSSNCYRPLQQLYKTVYSPMCENRSSRMNFACICRPAERYQTANMSYGSFHYNNWAYMQKTRPINYDRELFIQCYENTNKQQKLKGQSKCNNGFNDVFDSNEKQYWTQPTSDCCCPTDCCNDVSSNFKNC
ncbi:unnamed protein product [Rotaria socialis]|uniref:Uncharacterized protein n=1 Tax=Rotaria socialis TaxID=392032 RepID=A0A818XYZ1_9BILA|nr:unnamed protein product [Rotaria socialis]CAF3745654.1 unnamed protein product [Rotaria socialis]CAF4190834.1 unnamed protein product [Rotaria socialis]CAF4316335.1 unnamed protein product [Rotaria socialis]CAF4485138.1 unnamed protein product [Rotaria socialis]